MYRKIILLILVLASNVSFSANLNKDYSLVFVYESTCPYCQKMAPVVIDIQKEYSMNLYAVSADNKTLATLNNKDVINLPLSADITNKYYGSNPVRFPLLVLQQLNGEMKHYVIANGLTPKADVENILNSYLNYFNQAKQRKLDTSATRKKTKASIKQLKLKPLGYSNGGISPLDNSKLNFVNKNDLKEFGEAIFSDKDIDISIQQQISTLEDSLHKIKSIWLNDLNKEQKQQSDKALETVNNKLKEVLRVLNNIDQPTSLHTVLNCKGVSHD
jgi:thiol-disulfide isomerase/thioredoxin